MSPKKCLYFLILIVFTAPSLRAQNELRANSTATMVAKPDGSVAHPLRISAGDLLDLNVFDTKELSTKLRVAETGSITLPLGGSVSVEGMTAEEAGQVIEDRLRTENILKDPHVTVSIIEFATQGVTVLGEVKKPGVYPLLGARGLLDLISAAGGVTSEAGHAVTIAHRSDPDHPTVVKVDSKPGGNSSALNVDVRPGDTIIVSHAGIVYVVGDVAKPGGFLIENNDQLTVLQAVALAQGTNRTASLNHAKLIRKTESGPQELPIPLKKILSNSAPDQVLADGDILFVPSSGPKETLRDVESILPAAAGAAIYRAP